MLRPAKRPAYSDSAAAGVTRRRRGGHLLARPGRAHGVQELRLPHRFGQAGVHLHVLQLAHLADVPDGGQHHHQRVPVLRPLRDGGSHRAAVHLRHMVVEQHEVEGPPRAASLVERRERLRPRSVVGARHLPAGELLLQNAAVDRIVVDHQDAQAAQIAHRRCRGRRILVEHQRDGEPEGRSPAFLAAHPHRPAHQSHQLLRNREAQAGAAVFARSGAVHLGELLEQPAKFLRRDADAGVFHLDPHLRGVRSLVEAVDADDDMAVVGEFDGVARQVDDDLPQASRVADEIPRAAAG